MNQPQKRDCLFYVADKNMEHMIAGFLETEKAHIRLGCGVFKFDAKQDLKVASGQGDCGILSRADALLQPYASTHQRVIVILDAAFSGAPKAHDITKKVIEHCVVAGWTAEYCAAIVIAPELENWVWQENPHVITALTSKNSNITYDKLKQDLIKKEFWREGESKPYQPKKAMEYMLKQNNNTPRSSAIYKKLAAQMSIKNCNDPAFLKLQTTLKHWFPQINDHPHYRPTSLCNSNR